MTNKTYIQKFIKEFKFSDPDFSRLPEDFPYCNLERLSKSEKGIYGGIVLTWYNSPIGRKELFSKCIKTAGFSLTVIIALIGLISIVLNQPESITGTVSAATMKADEIVQSTMSAVLKIKN